MILGFKGLQNGLCVELLITSSSHFSTFKYTKVCIQQATNLDFCPTWKGHIV